jgi:hypothetical protein
MSENKSRVKPCKNCPFRTDLKRPFPLGKSRRSGIAESIGAKDEVFTCHKQLKLPAAKRRPCIGSAMVLSNEDLLLCNLAYRVHIALNNFPIQIENNVPVFANFKEFINAENTN